MNQVILSAIANKAVLRLEYHGFYRVVEPHAYGVNDLGHELLRCYQTSGGSESHEQQGWKLLLLSETYSISQSGATFAGARQDYKRGDKAMSRIYAQL
jgi:hypothetical protein